eukprot:gene11259-15107_t
MSESIYNLVPREITIAEKAQMFKSRHSHEVKPTGSTFGCHGTTRLLGAGEVVKKDGALYGPPAPESGLTSSIKSKRSTSLSPNQNSGTFKYEDRRKDTVPSKDEKPIMGITSGKNFITANAVEAILQVPKRIENRELNYMKKEDFGKIPAYLSQVKDEIQRENEMIDRYVKEQMGEIERPPEVFEEMTEDERSDLLSALKAKWDSVNAKYQKITHLVSLDTTGQVRRKESLEAQLQQLENDIEKLQRASNILIRK